MAAPGRSFPLVLLGLGLLLAGALLSSVAGTGTYLSRLLLLSGLAALIWGVARSWSTLLLFLRRMRQVAEPGPALTWLLVAAVLLVLAAGLGTRRMRFDLTGRGLHSLSATSRDALAGMPHEVELIGVYPEGSPDRERARDALEVYGLASRRIRTRLIDPERQPEEARRLDIRFKSGLLVAADSARQAVTELSEESITQAILRVNDPSRPVLGVLGGHGEVGEGRASLTRLRQAAARAGFRWEDLALASLAEVPDDVMAVLVIGPQSALLPGEARALERFLQRGGRAGLFLDPQTRTDLDELLAEHGVLVDGRVISDEGPLSRSAGLGPETIVVERTGEHAITRGLSAAIVLGGATRVGLSNRPLWGVQGADLLKSASSARLEGPPAGSPGAIERGSPARSAGSGAPGDSAAPPSRGIMPLGIALEWQTPSRRDLGRPERNNAPPERPSARLVVIGDSDFLRDEEIDLYGNREFANRILGWLGEREFLLRFPATNQAGTPLRVSLSGLRVIFYLVELLLPLVILGLGVAVWARRR